MDKLKSFIVFVTLDVICYFLMAIENGKFDLMKWNALSRLNFEAYIAFSLVLTIFYYIDRTWKQQ